MAGLNFKAMVRARPVSGLCELCRAWTPGRLCSACLERFAAPRPRCACCALPTGLATERCGECLADPPPWRRTVCAVDYAFPWDRLLSAFKFQGQTEFAAPLAALMLGALQATPSPPGAAPRPNRIDALLPVPLSPARLAERGYNQAWELARRLAREQGLPSRADVLLRPIGTTAQSGLGRAERQRNLRGAFMVEPRLRGWLAGRAVALVDDVMTTGATAREAAACLLRAGAASVDLWVVARTPSPLTSASPARDEATQAAHH